MSPSSASPSIFDSGKKKKRTGITVLSSSGKKMKLKDVYQQLEGKQDLDMQSVDSVREGSRYDRLMKENK